MTIDIFKKKRIGSNINAISNTLTKYCDENAIKEEELIKVLELVQDKERLLQLIQLL